MGVTDQNFFVWVGLLKRFCGSGLDWSNFFVGVRGIDQNSFKSYMDWSCVYMGVNRIVGIPLE